jgi:hypothetical protein
LEDAEGLDRYRYRAAGQLQLRGHHEAEAPRRRRRTLGGITRRTNNRLGAQRGTLDSVELMELQLLDCIAPVLFGVMTSVAAGWPGLPRAVDSAGGQCGATTLGQNMQNHGPIAGYARASVGQNPRGDRGTTTRRPYKLP